MIEYSDIFTDRDPQPNTINHKCSNCGECCSIIIPLTEKEVQVIKDYVKVHNIQPTNRINENNMNAKCCFLGEDNMCKIYEVRPYVCRDFKCDHKDWRQRRVKYAQRAKYNGVLDKHFKMATFDDLIYGDCSYLILMLAEIARDSNRKVDEQKFLIALERAGRQDILKHMKYTLEGM